MSSSNSTSSTGGPVTEPTSTPTTPSSTNPTSTGATEPTSSPSSSSSSSSSVTLPPTSSTQPPTTSSTTPQSSTSTTPSSTTPPPSSSSSSTPSSTSQLTTVVTTEGGVTRTRVLTVTTGAVNSNTETTTSSAPTGSSNSAINPADASNSGLGNGGKIAIAVVVPIAAIAILVLVGLWLWRKRKNRKELEEQRRKEVEDYGYNPNADPTIPAVGAAGPYEMKEDGTSGYRGWGTTTLAGSTAGKASTTMSGGAGVAYSDGTATSPTHGAISDTRSGEPLMHDGSPTPEGEILGAMGPSAANNRAGDVHRGPSNASSSYSGVAQSDGSGDGAIGVAYGGPSQYYDQYGNGNPYVEGAPGVRPPAAEMPAQPVIRDVTARRNTRIENPAHYPQQSAGISQNF